MANRIFYGCLGIANCGSTPIQGVQSVGLSISRSVNTIFTPGKKTPAGKYSNLPDIELSYTKYLDNIIAFDSEPGISSYAGFVILAGEDTAKCLGGGGALSTIGFTNLLLSSVTYTMSVDGPFIVERKYKGWSTGACLNSGLGVFANCSSPLASSVKRKGCFSATSIPSEISPHTLQSVTVSFSINRDFVNQFANRKPYASYINFPIETACTFDAIAKSLSNISFPEPTSCSNVSPTENNISISVGGAGAIQISKASLTALNYSGGDAKKGGSNLKISATYTSYETSSSIKPFIIL